MPFRAIPRTWRRSAIAGADRLPARELARRNWTRADEFCCTEGHSGAAGACEDMVINRATFKCAFVDDIHACKLPLGWSAKPEDIPVYEWECPGLYGWTDDVDCRSGSTNPGDEETDSGSGLIPVQCGGAIFGGLLIPFLGLVFFRRKNSTDIGSF